MIHVPDGLDEASYRQGRLDMQLEIAEREHWCERGLRVDAKTGKLVPIEPLPSTGPLLG